MNSTPRMIAVALLLSLAVAAGGCGFLEGNAAEPAEVEAVAVHTLRAERGDLARSLSFSARVEPAARADIVAEVSGSVEAIQVAEGDDVLRGDPLVSIDAEHLAIQLRGAQSQLSSALAGLDNARRALEVAEREVERLEPLYREGAISRQAWDRAQDDLEAARRAAEGSAPAAVSGARASVDAIRMQMDDAAVHAPIDGEVAVLAVSVGDQVAPGTHLVSISDRSRVEVVGLLSERQVVEVERGMAARIELTAYPDRHFEATIDHISASLAPSGSGYPVKLGLDNPGGRLRDGMAAEVFVEVERATGVLLVPLDALVDRETDPAVFVVEDNVARRRDVELGLSDGEVVEIRRGLDAGEVVVVTGQSYLADGSEVHIVGEDGNR